MATESVTQASRKRGLLRYIGLGLLATLFLLVVKLAVEHTHWGHENELWVFGKLQGSLSTIDLDNPIAILDISALPGGRVGDPTPTDRNKLKEIIGALAEVKPYPPRAIAVDINFSPKGHTYASEDDEDFFDFCNSIKDEKKIPVFLGVGETKSAPPEARLGNESYKDLAVAIAGNRSDTSRIPLWVKSTQSPKGLSTLNYALATEYRKHLASAPKWIDWAVDTNVEGIDEAQQHHEPIDDVTLTYADRLVNYSKLDQMKLAALPSTSADAVKQAAYKYANKLVILGDLNSDFVPVPGRRDNEPGCLVLASAAYTLIKEPLFEFKWWAGLLLDLIIAAFIIVPVALIRYKNPDDRVWIGKQALYVYIAVLVVLVLGWKLVSWAGVLWLDFLLVAFAVLLHPKVEHRIDHFLDARAARRLIRAQQTPSEPGKTVAGIVLILMASSSVVFAQQAAPRCEQNVAAIGLQLNTPQRKSVKDKVGTCYVRENKRSEWQSLSASDAKRQYRSGQHLSCDENCSLWILFCGTGTRHLVNVRQPKSFPVINAYRPPPPLNDSNPHNFGRISQTFVPSPAPAVGVATRTAIGRSVGALIGAIASGGKGAAIGAAIDDSPRHSRNPTSTGGTTTTKAGGNRNSNERTNDSSTPTIDLQFVELLRKADAARQKEDYTLAHQTYLEAQKLIPTDYRSFEGVGSIFADQQNWTAAEAAYRHALKLNPSLMRPKLGLAAVMLQQMKAGGDKLRVQEVEEILRWATSLSPGNEMVYDLFEQLFKLQEAEPARIEPLFRRAVSYLPTSARANLRLARVLYQLERQSEARKFMRLAEPYSFDRELLEAGRIYEINGRYKDAERVLRMAQDWRPNDHVILYHLGSVLVQRKRFREALKVLQRARDLDPNAFAPTLVFGIAQLETGNLAGAKLTLNEASTKVQQQADGSQRLAYWLAALGDAYHAKGQFAEAISAYKKSLTYNADNSDFQERLREIRRQYATKAPSP